MSKPKRGDVRIKRDVRIHSDLLHTSLCLLKQGKSVEAGSFHQFMASLVFTAFALEAYLNWLGEQFFPHWKFLERLSPKDKLTVICQKLEINLDYERRPAHTLNDLYKFRNLLAHGKPEIIEKNKTMTEEEYSAKLPRELAPTWLETYCSEKKAEEARLDVDQIINELHDAAGLELAPESSGFTTFGFTLRT